MKSVSISAGLSFAGIGSISAGSSFGKGTQDQPVWLSRTGTYKQMVYFASSISVVLYDTKMDRAWLMDGASALLHLTRTSLIAEPHVSSRLFGLDDFQHADPSCPRGNAAVAALTSARNLDLRIDEDTSSHIERKTVNGVTNEERIEKVTSWTFKDLVLQTWHSLEQIFDHQIRISKGPNINVRSPFQSRLEGFGFMDIVEGNFPMRPRQHTLKNSGKAWLPFTKTINAMTLFGTGFGDLIKSTNTTPLCRRWRQVPTGEEYLAVCLSTLKKISALHGDTNSKPIILAEGIHWNPEEVERPCTCGSRNYCERAQLFSKPAAKDTRQSKHFGSSNGAVVFGSRPRQKVPWSRSTRDEDTEANQVSPGKTSKSSSSTSSSTDRKTSSSATTASALTPDTTTDSKESILSKCGTYYETAFVNTELLMNTPKHLCPVPYAVDTPKVDRISFGQGSGQAEVEVIRPRVLRRKPRFTSSGRPD